MNFFWTEKEFDDYMEESAQKEVLGDMIYCLDLEEGLKAAVELFSSLKYIKKAN